MYKIEIDFVGNLEQFTDCLKKVVGNLPQVKSGHSIGFTSGNDYHFSMDFNEYLTGVSDIYSQTELNHLIKYCNLPKYKKNDIFETGYDYDWIINVLSKRDNSDIAIRCVELAKQLR